MAGGEHNGAGRRRGEALPVHVLWMTAELGGDNPYDGQPITAFDGRD